MCIHIDGGFEIHYTPMYLEIKPLSREPVMQTKIAEIADGIYRLSTFVP